MLQLSSIAQHKTHNAQTVTRYAKKGSLIVRGRVVLARATPRPHPPPPRLCCRVRRSKEEPHRWLLSTRALQTIDLFDRQLPIDSWNSILLDIESILLHALDLYVFLSFALIVSSQLWVLK